MIISHSNLMKMGANTVTPFNEKMVSTASIDICVGSKIVVEDLICNRDGKGSRSYYRTIDLNYLGYTSEEKPYYVKPGMFLLVATYEHVKVPNDCAIDLRLKNMIVKMGWSLSSGSWFEPNEEIDVIEIANITKWHVLKLWYGMPFAQIITHKLRWGTSDLLNVF